MCGIAGFFSINSFCTEQELHAMTDIMVHRGPDASGYFYEKNVGLGHRRLSIIDLSAAANQPMISHNRQYIIVYNGEVYNFKEIAAEMNIPFNTASDTEVILEAFVKWGADCANRFNGMFAIAIYDKVNDELHLFRDRLGIKPLFYFYDGNNFAFGSEIKALLQPGKVRQNLAINETAISQYLYLGYIPEPNTIYKNIFKFPSGAYGKINKIGFEFKHFWKPEDKINAKTEECYPDSKARFKELINKSVQYRLISDVPYGVFLSGGIDSSLVSCCCQEAH